MEYVDKILKYCIYLEEGITVKDPATMKDHKKFCDGIKDCIDLGMDKANGFDIVFVDKAMTKLKKEFITEWKSFADVVPKPLFK